MPRSGDEYSLPPGTVAVSNTSANSAHVNSRFADLEAEQNLARPVTKGGTGATSAAAARTALGLEIGVNVQAYDADLAAMAALGYTSGAYLLKKTAAGTFSLIALTAAGEALIDDADAAAQLTTLGIGGDIPAIEALASTGIAVRTAADTWAQRTIVSADSSVTITNPGGVAGNIDLSVPGGGVSASTAASSGTAIDIGSIPATATRIWLLFSAVSLSGTDDLLIQIGDSGGFENTGYVSGSRETAASSTAGFILFLGNASRAAHGVMELVKGDGNQWFEHHAVYTPTICSAGGGTKTLSDTLTQIRLTRTGTDTLDGSGTITVRWA